MMASLIKMKKESIAEGCAAVAMPVSCFGSYSFLTIEDTFKEIRYFLWKY